MSGGAGVDEGGRGGVDERWRYQGWGTRRLKAKELCSGRHLCVVRLSASGRDLCERKIRTLLRPIRGIFHYKFFLSYFFPLSIFLSLSFVHDHCLLFQKVFPLSSDLSLIFLFILSLQHLPPISIIPVSPAGISVISSTFIKAFVSPSLPGKEISSLPLPFFPFPSPSSPSLLPFP